MEEANNDNWYRRLGSPRYVLAPMVDQSEHAFRVLCRRHGTHLAYTPMISSRQFISSAPFREGIFGELEGKAECEDRPLVVQFAGNDPQVLLAAAKHVEMRCDAVDINLGCPQKIAKRGRYGAWLLDEPALLQQLVGTLHCHLACPVTVKIRLLQGADGAAATPASISQTVDLARMLQGAGASVVAVHGRTREQKGHAQGSADWDGIAAVKAALSVPVLANGGVYTAADAEACLKATGADGVLSGEGLLENPALFEGRKAGDRPEALALEYLELQRLYPADLRSVKQHLFSMCYAGLQVYTELRQAMHRARTLEQMHEIVCELARRPREARAPFNNAPGDAYTSWYRRHTWEEERTAQRLAANAAAASAAEEATEEAIDDATGDGHVADGEVGVGGAGAEAEPWSRNESGEGVPCGVGELEARWARWVALRDGS